MKNIICPICKASFFKKDGSLKCPSGHTYDISKYNYVNFSNGGKVHGDNKEMIVARRAFLDRGFYEPLKNCITEVIKNFTQGGVFLDAGCGEGYYTQAIAPLFDPDGSWAIDISKDALVFAHKRMKTINLAVASVYDMPFFADGSFDLVTSIFSPFASEEFSRVLKKDGILLSVIPGRYHLYGLKKIVYDDPYENEVKKFDVEGFEFLHKSDVEYEITVDSEFAETLWKMTPYYYRTPRSGMERLLNIEKVTTPISFHVVAYRTLKGV